MGAFATVMFILGGYTLRRYQRNFLHIELSDEGISYGRRAYRWSQVVDKQLEGKLVFKYMWTGRLMDGMSLTFNDGETLQIFAGMYKNADELRNYIATRTQHVIAQAPGTSNDTPVREPDPEATRSAIRKVRLYIGAYVLSSLALGIYAQMVGTTETIHLILKLVFVAYVLAGAIAMRAFIKRVGKDL